MNLVTKAFKEKTYPSLQKSIFSMPRDLLLEIFCSSLLKAYDIASISLTCKNWYQITHDSFFYQKRLENVFFQKNISKEQAKAIYEEHCRPQRNFHEGVYFSKSLIKFPTHFENVIRHFQITKNQIFINCSMPLGQIDVYDKHGNFQTILQIHPLSITCFKAIADKIFIGSQEGIARIYTKQGDFILELPKMLSRITAIETFNERVFLGTRNGTLNICNMDGREIHLSRPHSKEISFFHLQDDGFFSLSKDGSAILWDFNGKSQAIFKGHSQSITCLESQNEKIFTGSADKTVKIWNKNEYLLHTLFHSSSVNNLHIAKKTLFTASENGEVNIWDFSGHLLSCLFFKNPIRILKVQEGLLAVADGNVIKVFNVKTKAHLYTLFTKNSFNKEENNEIKAFEIDENQIIASYSCFFGIWDFSGSTNEILKDLSDLFFELPEHDNENFKLLLQRFSKLSEEDKNGVYEQLYFIIHNSLSSKSAHLDSAKAAFSGKKKKTISNNTRATALTKYLNFKQKATNTDSIGSADTKKKSRSFGLFKKKPSS